MSKQYPPYENLGLSAADGEKHFRSVLEALPTGAYTCDPDGLITYYNDHAVRIWGRAPRLNDAEDRFCGSFKLSAADGTPIRHDRCWMALALRCNQGYNRQEIVVEQPSGDRRAVLAYANPIRDDAGKLLGAVNVLVDISEHKQSEEVMRASRDAAVASNKAKDHFLAALSHELRTPLSPIVMSLAAMENNPRLPDEFRDEIAMIRRNIDLELALMDDLLDVSRAITGKLRLQMQNVSVHEKLRHVIEDCKSDLFGKRLGFNSFFDATNDLVIADPARLQQVFWNLLRNAAKFTPPDGDVFVRTWNDQADRLCIEVRDTGIGISSEALPRIFEAFEQEETQTTRQFGGLGLGLSIAKSVIEIHGGSIVAKSEGKGKGATFTVCLDTLSPEASIEPNAIGDTGNTQPPRRSRILIVEDHVDTARMMARLLELAGHKVQTAHTAASALELAGTETFDILVSDIGLPDATGYDLMAQLRERYSIRGIALSGYGTEDDIQRSTAAGFLEHLIKPVSFAQLQAAIDRLALTLNASASE